MQNTRLNYYLAHLGVEEKIPKNQSIGALLQQAGIPQQTLDEINAKYQQNLELKRISKYVAITGGIITAIQYAELLDKVGSTLDSFNSFFNLVDAIGQIDLDNFTDIASVAISGLSFLEAVDQLGNVIEMAAHTTDAIEATSTLGLSLVASVLAKKAFDKINAENENILANLLEKNKYLNQVHMIFNKELSPKIRKEKPKLLTLKIPYRQLIA